METRNNKNYDEVVNLLREADKLIIWETAGMDRLFQERVEAALDVASHDYTERKRGRPKIHPDRKAYQAEWVRKKRAKLTASKAQ